MRYIEKNHFGCTVSICNDPNVTKITFEAVLSIKQIGPPVYFVDISPRADKLNFEPYRTKIGVVKLH